MGREIMFVVHKSAPSKNGPEKGAFGQETYSATRTDCMFAPFMGLPSVRELVEI